MGNGFLGPIHVLKVKDEVSLRPFQVFGMEQDWWCSMPLFRDGGIGSLAQVVWAGVVTRPRNPRMRLRCGVGMGTAS